MMIPSTPCSLEDVGQTQCEERGHIGLRRPTLMVEASITIPQVARTDLTRGDLKISEVRDPPLCPPLALVFLTYLGTFNCRRSLAPSKILSFLRVQRADLAKPEKILVTRTVKSTLLYRFNFL